MIVRVKRSVFYRVFHSNKEMIKLYLQGCVPMHFYDCPDIASLESWGNFYMYKVFILNIKFCFTCSEWKLYYNFVKFSNIMNSVVWKILLQLLFLKMIHIYDYSAILTQIRTTYQKCCHQQKMKEKLNFWSKSNMPKEAYKTFFKFESSSELGCLNFLVKSSERL